MLLVYSYTPKQLTPLKSNFKPIVGNPNLLPSQGRKGGFHRGLPPKITHLSKVAKVGKLPKSRKSKVAQKLPQSRKLAKLPGSRKVEKVEKVGSFSKSGKLPKSVKSRSR